MTTCIKEEKTDFNRILWPQVMDLIFESYVWVYDIQTAKAGLREHHSNFKLDIIEVLHPTQSNHSRLGHFFAVHFPRVKVKPLSSHGRQKKLQK